MIFLAVAIGLLPGLAWLVLYLQEDPKPEPFFTIVRTLIVGAVSAFIALAVQLLISGNFVGDPVGAPLGTGLVILFATSEEIIKFLAVFVTIRYAAAFDEPVDAIIYPVIGALGFASVENIAVAYELIANDALGDAFEVLALRFVGATLIHGASAALVGYWWSRTLMKTGKDRGALIGLVFAAALHATFNLFILSFGNTTYTFLLLLGAGLLVLLTFSRLRHDERILGYLPS